VSDQETMELRLPADAAYLSVARMFGGSVARTFGLDAERAEDLRLALSEICAAAVEEHSGAPSTVAIDVSWDDAAVRISCADILLAADAPRWMLLQALMPDVRVDGDGAVAFSIAR
jgi:anti-sigma regulatory factor (Ser/Thr protein kinase)